MVQKVGAFLSLYVYKVQKVGAFSSMQYLEIERGITNTGMLGCKVAFVIPRCERRGLNGDYSLRILSTGFLRATFSVCQAMETRARRSVRSTAMTIAHQVELMRFGKSSK